MRKSERKNKRELPAAAKSAAEAAVGIFSTFSKAADAIGKGANGIYMKFPEMPILGRSGTAMLVFSAAIYVFFVMFVFFTLPPITISTSFSEGSLQPNAVLALQPSEKYAYASSLADGAEVLEYSVGRGQGCSGMAIDEVSGGKGTQTLCIMPDGSLLGETNRDKSGYGNKTIILFAPWMLSVSENFSWTVAVVSKGGGISVTNEIDYSCNRIEKIAGRDAYPVEIGDGSLGGLLMTMHIDAEKRILLEAESGNGTIRLVRAPFALNWTNN